MYFENGVSQPKDGRQYAENAVDHVERYAQHVKGQPESVEFVNVRYAVDGYAARLIQAVEKLGRFQFVQLHQILVVLSGKIIRLTFICKHKPTFMTNRSREKMNIERNITHEEFKGEENVFFSA